MFKYPVPANVTHEDRVGLYYPRGDEVSAIKTLSEDIFPCIDERTDYE